MKIERGGLYPVNAPAQLCMRWTGKIPLSAWADFGKSFLFYVRLETVLSFYKIKDRFEPTICNTEAKKATVRSPLRSTDPDGAPVGT